MESLNNTNMLKVLESLIQENKELVNTLKNLWNVRGTPFTLEQTQYQKRVYIEVEEILKKYSE